MEKIRENEEIMKELRIGVIAVQSMFTLPSIIVKTIMISTLQMMLDKGLIKIVKKEVPSGLNCN